jgi:predicted HTH transcriptional regulator
LTQAPLPENRSQIVEALRQAEMVSYDVETEWSITNLGALLLAKDLREFPALSRKAPRVVRYDGRGRASTIRRQDGQRGYAAGFDGLIDYLMALLPQREIIEGALRTTVGYPVLAVRELVANALIHQDLSITGMGTMVEVFDDRIEITNPGKPLIPVDRFIDLPPRSRNEKLSGAMRRLRICEEQGSGWDKVTAAIELHQLPPPLVETQENATRVVVFGPRPLARMEKADRIRAVYQHACLRYVMHENMTNTTVRQRFGLDDKARPTASRLIREAVNARAVVAYDPTVGNKSLRYVPWWASPGREAVS